MRAESFYDSTVEKYAAQEVEVLSLRQMLHFGRNAWDDPEKICKSARYVQRELPKRLARRLLDLQLLPYIVVTNPHIKKVYNQYHVSFETFRRLPPVRTLEENQEYTQILRQHLDQHAPMLDSLAQGLRECKSKELVGPALALDGFFDSMLRSRISRRVLAEQHLHINNKRPAYIGIVCTDLDVNDAIDFAIQKAKQVCMETYGQAPEVVVSGDPKVSIPYIPAHLDYMLYELLKNAMRAVVEFHSASRPAGAAPYPKLPPVHVRICSGFNDLTLKVSDQGGGIPPDLSSKVWSYGFTTIGAPAAPPDEASGAGDPFAPEGLGARTRSASTAGASSGGGGGKGGSSASGLQGLMGANGGGSGASSASRYRMAGLGFGLPLSRVYARYFGGDLKLQSIPGYGTDAYLTLVKLEEQDWREPLDDPKCTHIQAWAQ